MQQAYDNQAAKGLYVEPLKQPPRKMVRGDLVSESIFPQSAIPPAMSWDSIEVEYGRREHSKVWVSCPPRYRMSGGPGNFQNLPKMTFSEWATNIRTKKLMERCVNAEAAEIKMRLTAARALTELDEMKGPLDNYVGQAALAKHESELQNLRATAKVNEEFIAMQANRLINARNHLTRVRYHCDLPEQGDSGKGLDP
jgi:hypothetical protein